VLDFPFKDFNLLKNFRYMIVLYLLAELLLERKDNYGIEDKSRYNDANTIYKVQTIV